MFRFFKKKPAAPQEVPQDQIQGSETDSHPDVTAEAVADEIVAFSPPDIQKAQDAAIGADSQVEVEAEDWQAEPEPESEPVPESESEPEPESEPQHTKTSWLSRLKSGLAKTGQSISTLFVGVKVDQALFEELETALIMADTGVEATEQLLARLRARVKKDKIDQAEGVRQALRRRGAWAARCSRPPTASGSGRRTGR